jgi:rhodanese-related sulfurtransferase
MNIKSVSATVLTINLVALFCFGCGPAATSSSTVTTTTTSVQQSTTSTVSTQQTTSTMSTTSVQQTTSTTPVSTTSTTKSSSTTTVSTTPTLPEVELVFPDVQRVSAEDLKKMIETKADFVLVDAESADVYAAGHIPGAINIPYNPIDTTFMDLRLIGLPSNKTIVFYCQCNDEASSGAIAMEAARMGLKLSNLRALRGGYGWWITLAYPIETGAAQ